MRCWNRAITTSIMLLASACGSASSQQPDSSNPAHCVAAFAYGRGLALGGKRRDLDLAVQSTARALFEGKKMKASGTFTSGRREGAAFFDTYGRNGQVMMPLLVECAKRQDADPAYRSLNQRGILMAAARKADTACQSDAKCRTQ